MNRKTNCICLSVLLAVAAATSSQYASASSPDASLASTLRGGQAPPPASGGSTFAVKIASNLDKGAADSLRQDLINEGFTAAENQLGADGKYEVVIKGLPSRDQAARIIDELKGSGYTTSVEIVTEGANSAPSPGTGQSIYRVKVAEFDNAAQATEASKVLLEERFVNVDIVEDNGKHILMLGTFNREQDAQALLGDVNNAGFALASVVKREKLNTSTGAAAQADLSSLPAAQQAATRDVLALTEKARTGEATAEEIQRLRQQIEELTENQKAIITQQESNRSAEQNKIQKVYPIYREFDQALRAKNFEKAEQLLAQAKQVNPNDIFLPGKEKMLREQRSGGEAPVSSPDASAPGRPDPAQLQQTINEARAAETSGDKAGALQKYNDVLAMDPTNVEARGKVADLGSPAAGSTTETADGTDNKMLIYGGAALAALILLLFGWMKMRGKKTAVSEPTPAAGSAYAFNSVDPLAGANPTPTGISPLGTAATLSTADMSSMPGMHSFGVEDEEPETPVAKPAPAPKPVTAESESVSLEDMMGEPTAPPPAAASPSEEFVPLNLDDETAPAAPAPSPASTVTPAAGSSAMDADLEALLKGTFAGASETPAADQSANIGEDILTVGAIGAGAGAASQAEPTVVFEQDFASEDVGTAPKDWRGEYDYATLAVVDTDDPAHVKALKFEKNEGAGSATYHLSFPKASGKIIAEFDLRCDHKNKFLLGVYFEKDEDFKQSIHTIIHQLDPNSPATLRIQGEAASYEMGTWSHIRFEVDLANGNIDAYMDGNHVVKEVALTVVPEYINTLSIRDNLATTGTLLLDNIRVSEA